MPELYAAPDKPIIVELDILEAKMDRPIKPQVKVRPPKKRSSLVLFPRAIQSPKTKIPVK